MAKIRIPQSTPQPGPLSLSPKQAPPQNVGSALKGLGEALSKYAQSEAVRKDRNLLISNPVEGLFQDSAISNMQLVVYDAEGGVDFENTIEKGGNIIASEEALFQKSIKETQDKINDLPFESEKSRDVAFAQLQGLVAKQGTSEQRKEKLVGIMDDIKLSEIKNKVYDYTLDPTISSVEDLFTGLVDISDSMAVDSDAKQFISREAGKILDSSARNFTGAMQIIGGFKNEALNNASNPFKATAINTLNATLGMVKPSRKLTDTEKSNSFGPVDLDAMEELNNYIGTLPEGEGRTQLETVLGSAVVKQSINAKYGINTMLVLSGDVERSDSSLNQAEYDDYLESVGAYKTEDLEEVKNLLLYWKRSTVVFPEHAKNLLHTFLNKASYDTQEEQALFRLFASQRREYFATLTDDQTKRLDNFANKSGSFENRIQITPDSRSDLIESDLLSSERYNSEYRVEHGINIVDDWTFFGDSVSELVEGTEYFSSSFLEEDSDIIKQTFNSYVDEAFNQMMAEDPRLIPSGNQVRQRALQKFLSQNRFIELEDGVKKFIPSGLSDTFVTEGGQTVTPTDEHIKDYMLQTIKDDPSVRAKVKSRQELEEFAQKTLREGVFRDVDSSLGVFALYSTSDPDVPVIMNFDSTKMKYDFVNQDYLITENDLKQMKEFSNLSQLGSKSWSRVALPSTLAAYLPTKEKFEAFSKWDLITGSGMESVGDVQDWPMAEHFSDLLETKEFKGKPVEEQVSYLSSIGNNLKRITQLDPFLTHPILQPFLKDAYISVHKQAFERGDAPQGIFDSNWSSKMYGNTLGQSGNTMVHYKTIIFQEAGNLYADYVNSLSPEQRSNLYSNLINSQINPNTLVMSYDIQNVVKREYFDENPDKGNLFAEAFQMQKSRKRERGKDSLASVEPPTNFAPYAYYLEHSPAEYKKLFTKPVPYELEQLITDMSQSSSILNSLRQGMGSDLYSDEFLTDTLRLLVADMFEEDSVQQNSIFAIPNNQFLDFVYYLGKEQKVNEDE
jgi:hypothetical protein